MTDEFAEEASSSRRYRQGYHHLARLEDGVLKVFCAALIDAHFGAASAAFHSIQNFRGDGRWERRGRGGDKLCMCRLGDRGPYADWNVYAATFRENCWPAEGQ